MSRIDVGRLKLDVNMLALLPADANVRPCGRNHWRAKCPIHGGTGMTLGIWYGGTGWSFTCFACNEQGSVIDFFMKVERISFKEAIAKLAGSDLGPPVVMWAPPVTKKSHVIPCLSRGCGERLEVDLADVPYLGVSLALSWDFCRRYVRGELVEVKGTCWRCMRERSWSKGRRAA